MTSDEIKTHVSKVMPVGDLAFWLREIAYQMAVRNEHDSLVTSEPGKRDAVSEGRTIDPFFVPGDPEREQWNFAGELARVTADRDAARKSLETVLRLKLKAQADLERSTSLLHKAYALAFMAEQSSWLPAHFRSDLEMFLGACQAAGLASTEFLKPPEGVNKKEAAGG